MNQPLSEGAQALYEYQVLVGCLDELWVRAQARYGAALRCAPGCGDCCGHDLSLLPIEQAQIWVGLAVMAPSTRERIRRRAQQALDDRDAACPLLEDDRCQVYAVRPLICRSQGLLIAVPKPSGGSSVAFCPHNFLAFARAEKDLVVDLQAIHFRLKTANTSWCRSQNCSEEPGWLGRVVLGSSTGTTA